MIDSEGPRFSDGLRAALPIISARDLHMQEFGELLGLLGPDEAEGKSADLERLARCITTPQGRAFLRGGLHTQEGREWLGLKSKGTNEEDEIEIRECDLLKWAFTAELMQIGVPGELALSFVEQGITLRDIKSKTAEDLAEQQWAQIKGLMGPNGFPEEVLEMLLRKPESTDVRVDSRRGDQPLFEPSEIKRLLKASFSEWRDRLAGEERKLERDKLKEVLKESGTLRAVDIDEDIQERQIDLLVRPGLGLGFDEIRSRSLQNLSEALYHAELSVDGISFAALFAEAVRRASGMPAGSHDLDFSQLDSEWRTVARENEHRPFVTLVEGIRQTHAQRRIQAEVSPDLTKQPDRWAKNLLQSSIRRAIWRMFRTWKRAIETSPKRDDTLLPVRFYDLLAVSDFHAAAGNHPSPEGIARLNATEDFYFDDAFFRFLYYCEMERRKRGGNCYELVFNGDMLDFAQVVVPLDQRPPLTPWPLPPFLEFSPRDPTGSQSLSAGDRSLPFRLLQTLAQVHGIGPLAKAAYEQSKVLRAAGETKAALNLDRFLREMLRAALEDALGTALEDALRAAQKGVRHAEMEEAESPAEVREALRATMKQEPLLAGLKEEALLAGLNEGARRAALKGDTPRAEVGEAPSAGLGGVSSTALKEVLHENNLEEVWDWLDKDRDLSDKDRGLWAHDEAADDWTSGDEALEEWAKRGTWDSGDWSGEEWTRWAYQQLEPEPDERAHEAADQLTGEAWTARDMARPRVLAMQRESALEQLADVYRGHQRMFQGLAWFLAQGNRLIVLRGNHDPQWYWPEVQLAFVGWLKNAYVELRKECKSPDNYELPVSAPELEDYLPARKLEEFEARIDLDHSWYYYRDRLAYFEHGGQQEAVDAHRFFLLPVYYEDAPATAHRKTTIQPGNPQSWLPALQASPVENEIEPPLGSLGQVFFVNNLETQFPNFDRPGYIQIYRENLKPALILYLLVAVGRTLGALWKWALYGLGPWRRWVWRQLKETPRPWSFRNIGQVIRSLPEWRGGPHDRKLNAYARLTGLPLECTKALDRASWWVRAWRAPVVGVIFKLLSIMILVAAVAAVAVVVLLAVLEWQTEFLATRDLPWLLAEAVKLLPSAPQNTDPELVKAWLGNILRTLLWGLALGWIVKQLPKAVGLGEDYLYKPSQRVAAILEKYGHAVPYILFGHDHVRNAQRLEEGPWYLNTGSWLHKYENDRKRLVREPLEYAFVRMVDTHRVLAAGPDDYMTPRPETRPQVELLRWNDNGGRVESCETFRGLDELSVSNEYELIRRHEPILRFSRDEAGNPENFFPMAAENYVRECGLRRRRHLEWICKPGETTLRRLGQLREAPRGLLRRLYYRLFRERDLHEYYLVFAAGDTEDEEVVFKLLDRGLELARVRARSSSPDRGLDTNEQGETVLRAVVRREVADNLDQEPGQWGEITRQALGAELNPEEKELLGRQERQLELVIPTGLLALPEKIHKRARDKYEPYRDWREFPPVYHYHICQDSPYTVLQYWFLYAYNDWGYHGGLNDHEGDWEAVFVFLDQKQQPQRVAYSRHIKVPVLFEPDTAEWSEVVKGGSHPTVYVGCGSHASYTKAGRDRILGWLDCHEGDGLQIGPDTAQPWGRPIRLSNKAWNSQFPGNWGALIRQWGLLVKPSTEGPTGPARKGDKWEKPAKWANIPGRSLF